MKLVLNFFLLGFGFYQAWNCGILEQNTAFTSPAYLAPAWLLLHSAGVLCGTLETSVSGDGVNIEVSHEVLHHLLVKVVSCNNMA